MSDFDYELIRSNRKSVSIQLKPDGSLLVRAPLRTSKREIDAIVAKHSDWIIKHRKKQAREQEERQGDNIRPLTQEDMKALAERAMQVIPERVAYYAPKVGVTYGRITIRNQKTRWGSCSAKGNLNFNCLLMLTPIEVIDSVVVHELCHRLEMNHSRRFYEEVYRVYPEYDKWDKWLKEHGQTIMRRMTG